MKFTRVNYTNMMLDLDVPVKKTYVTSIQDNNYQNVDITASDCKKSVKFFSRIKKLNKD